MRRDFIMEENLTVIEIRLKLLRVIKGLTQEELANSIGVSRALINSWENGYADISLRQLVKLSAFFQVPIDYILGLVTKLFLVFKECREWAKIIHIERSGISSYENGKMSISTSALKEVCNTFGYSADWCLGNTSICIKRKKKVILNENEIKEFISI